MLSECVGERSKLEVAFMCGSCKLVIVCSFAKYCVSVFLQKNGTLGEFYSLLVIDWSGSVTGLRL